MIETFVQQRVSDPDMWYSRIPQYLRTGTNPIEKTRFLEEICEIVDRIELGAGLCLERKTSKHNVCGTLAPGSFRRCRKARAGSCGQAYDLCEGRGRERR